VLAALSVKIPGFRVAGARGARRCSEEVRNSNIELVAPSCFSALSQAAPLNPRGSGQNGRGWLGGGLPCAKRGGAWRAVGRSLHCVWDGMEVLFGLFDAVSASELLFSPIANHLHTSLLKVWTRTLLRLGRPRSCPRPLSETHPGDKRDVLAHHRAGCHGGHRLCVHHHATHTAVGILPSMLLLCVHVAVEPEVPRTTCRVPETGVLVVVALKKKIIIDGGPNRVPK